MPFEHWEAFAAFAHSSIRKYYALPGASFTAYCKNLTDLVSEVIGEKRISIQDRNISADERIGYIDSMISKIDILYSNLFEERNEGWRFLPDGLIIGDEDNDEITSARQLRKNIITLRGIFRLESGKLQLQTRLVYSTPRAHKRVPSRESFEIMEGKVVNLRAVHKHLINEVNPFIDIHTTYNDFEVAFSGNPVTNKVSWLSANALHYFIDKIHGVGVQRANEGQWARASRCFAVNGKDITPDQIKDAGDPVASISALLDRAITPFE